MGGEADRRGAARSLAPLSLLTVKPILYAANVTDAELSGDEGPHLKALRAAVAASGEQAEVVPFSAKIESGARRAAAGGPRGFPRIARPRVRGTRSAHSRRLPPARPADVLHRRRAGSARVDDPSRRHRAAGGRRDPHRLRARLHPRPRRSGYDDFVANGGWKGARKRASCGQEGKEYVVQDGDVLLFRFNV